MLVDARGLKPPAARTVALAQASERAVICYRRPSYQALLGRKNPLSSKTVAA